MYVCIRYIFLKVFIWVLFVIELKDSHSADILQSIYTKDSHPEDTLQRFINY